MSKQLDYLQKAEKYLVWSRKKLDSLNELASDAPLEEHEQHYAELLAHENVASEMILDAATAQGRQDIHHEITADKRSDDFLYYFWRARVAEVHHLLSISDARNIKYRFVDKSRNYQADAKAMGINVPSLGHYGICIAFGSTRLDRATRRMNRGDMPRYDALRRAGIEIVSDRRRVWLGNFSYVDSRTGKSVDVKRPDTHFGATVPPTVDFASEAVIAYYEKKLALLRVESENPA